MEINRSPNTEGLNDIEKISVGMIPAMFTEDGEQTLERIKNEYLNFRNDAMRAARSRMEKALFRLYEACRLVFSNKRDVDLLGYAFDDDYYAQVNAEVEACFDRTLAEEEYELALAAVREKNYKTAGEHFKIAALNGLAAAQYNYGVTVANGEMGEAPDAVEGAFWYYKAAKAGYEKAMVNMAVSYRQGNGIFSDGVMMLYWYSMAAKTLFPYGVHNLGLCLANEEVLTGNASLGRRLLQAAHYLEDEECGTFVRNISSQIIEWAKNNAYNV